jgi:cold shock CspA family protein
MGDDVQAPASDAANSLGSPPIVLDRGLLGTVAAFDADAGWGELRAEDGSVLPFHCTAVADGSRRIDVGTEVRYDVAAGRMGRWEAANLTPRPAGRGGGGPTAVRS